MATTYFSDTELSCECCGVVALAPGFGDRIDEFRRRWNRPISPTSVCRCIKHNQAVGGKPNSFHRFDKKPGGNPLFTPGTCAMDIPYRTGQEAYALLRLAIDMGFCVGLNERFIHIDDRTAYTGDYPSAFTY